LLLRDGVIILGAAMFFVMLFRRFGLGAVLGYLVAGALIGPSGLGLITAPEEMLHIADFGIVLLLFLVGLELHPSRLWRLKQDIFGLGLLQVAVSGVAISALIYMLAGFSPAASLAIGLPLALSSTAQVLPSLRSDGSINTPAGERAFSVLLFQDLSIVPLITIIAALSRAPVDPSAPSGLQLAFYTVAAIVGLVAVGHFVINPLFRLVGRIAERDLFVSRARSPCSPAPASWNRCTFRPRSAPLSRRDARRLRLTGTSSRSTSSRSARFCSACSSSPVGMLLGP
jgi:glutathione-regulated potassium-efflux system protein KefB